VHLDFDATPFLQVWFQQPDLFSVGALVIVHAMDSCPICGYPRSGAAGAHVHLMLDETTQVRSLKVGDTITYGHWCALGPDLSSLVNRRQVANPRRWR
jgi:hypothetical protein